MAEIIEKENNEAPLHNYELNLKREANTVVGLEEKMLGLVKVNDRLTAQQVKERDAFNKSQLFSTQTHKKFNMQELTNIMVK